MGDISTHFSKNDIMCPCGCEFMHINPVLLHRLELVQSKTGFDMIISSWCRCAKHNREIGGVNTSSHLVGEAADIIYKTKRGLLVYLFWLLHFGFGRIKIYPKHIHADIAPHKTYPYIDIDKEVWS